MGHHRGDTEAVAGVRAAQEAFARVGAGVHAVRLRVFELEAEVGDEGGDFGLGFEAEEGRAVVVEVEGEGGGVGWVGRGAEVEGEVDAGCGVFVPGLGFAEGVVGAGGEVVVEVGWGWGVGEWKKRS